MIKERILPGRTFLCTRRFQRIFLVHKKATQAGPPCACVAVKYSDPNINIQTDPAESDLLSYSHIRPDR